MADIKESVRQIRNASAMFQAVITISETLDQLGDDKAIELMVIKANKMKKELESLAVSTKEARASFDIEQGKVSEIANKTQLMANNLLLDARAIAKPGIDAEQEKIAQLKAQVNTEKSTLNDIGKRIESARVELLELQNKIAFVKAKAAKELAL